MNDKEIYKQFGCGHLECRLNKQAVNHYEEVLAKVLAVVENFPSAQCQEVERIINEGIKEKEKQFAVLKE